MKKQLLHEAHNLQDKAKKPDYRERFQDEGGNFDRGGTTVNPELRFRGANLIIDLKPTATEEKMQMIERFRRHFKVIFHGNVGTVPQLMKNPQFAKEINERFEMTAQSIRRANQFHWTKHPKKNRNTRVITYRCFLEPVELFRGLTVIDVFAFLPEIVPTAT